MSMKETLCDSMREWVEGKSDGVLQDLKEKYNTSYYDALQRNDAFLTRTTASNEMVIIILIMG